MRTKLINPRSKAPISVDPTKGTRHLIGRNDEVNAVSKKDLIERIAGLVDLVQAGEVESGVERDASYEAECTQLVQAAMDDRTMATGGGRYVMGETIGDAVWETTGRLGFTSKFLLRHDVPQGTEGRIRVRQKNVVSWIITRESAIPRSVVNQPWVYPPIVTIATYLTIDDTERAMAPVELMDEKYTELLEATMVREDNYTRYLWTAAAPVYNDVFTFADLTPALFSSMQIQVQRWGLSCPHAAMSIDLWTDIRTNSDFLAAYEPVSKLTLIEEGRLGKLYDTEIYTDGLRYETLQVLEPGEIFFLAEPQGLGGYCEYMPLQTKPADLHHIGIGAEGWYAHMSRGYAIANSRGIVWGYKSS